MMKIKQLHELINTVTQEVLGKEAVVQEDLGNVVDIGKEIINSDNVDNYVKKLVNHIGKVVFKNRVYSGSAPSVLMDSWEWVCWGGHTIRTSLPKRQLGNYTR